MMEKTVRAWAWRLALGLLVAGAIPSSLWAQTDQAAQASPAVAPQPAAAPASGGRLEPVFSVTPPGLAWVEGEDAVSTNMASEPTLNYGCSGKRALQLSRSAQLANGSAYYAEYCVYVEREGNYELWYGGTPPGPKDEFSPSFSSPFSIAIDGGAPRPLFREDVNVVQSYTPAYYWVRTIAVHLSKGSHVLRFEVDSKRRLDGRFFFYLDALFLASSDTFAAAKADRSGFPSLFPSDPENRDIDHPFRSFEDYQAQIQSSPATLAPYLELAAEYSLVGDYLDALKSLSKAAVVAPKDPGVKLLMAKNRIWRGDVKEGLDAYGAYLAFKPDDLGAYEEAGKIAAWSGRYPDSEYFYKKGLAVFPEEVSLQVNLGLSLLWAGRVGEAEASFDSASRKALASPESAAALAAVYRENGFPDRAAAVYEKAIAAFPDRLGLYLDEESLLAASGKDAEAKAIEARVVAAFEPSPELDAALGTARARRELKASRIADFEARVAAAPDNLELRDELTRVYAWNGRKLEAVRELESVLAARFVRELGRSDEAIADVHAAQFSAAAIEGEADALTRALDAKRGAVLSAQAAVDKALADLAAREKAAEAAKAAQDAGKTAPAGTAEAAEAARVGAAAALAGFSEAIGAFEAEYGRISSFTERSEAIKAALDSAEARDASDEAAFKSLAKSSSWAFDPLAAASEFAGSAGRGEAIASLARARLLLPKDLKSSQGALGAVASDALGADKSLASLMIEARRDYGAIYRAALEESPAPALAEAAQTLAALQPKLGAPETSAKEADAAAPVPENAASLAAGEAGLKQRFDADGPAAAQAKIQAAAARNAAASLVARASTLQDKRLERAFYAFESSSLELRGELASYYDGLGRAGEAARQYRHILALDPGNLQAMYSMGLAEDRAGDWYGAAALFKAVYSADPYYGNAAALHNAIERREAQGVDVSTTLLADSNLVDYRSAANFFLPLDSSLSLAPKAEMRSIRDRSQGYPAYLSAELGLEADFRLIRGSGGAGLVLKPRASLIGTSADFASEGAASVSPAEFLGAMSLYSAAGLGLDWNIGPYRTSFDYSYAPLPGSVNPSSSYLYAHRLEVSGGAYFPMGGAFRYLAPRVYASGGYVPGDSGNLYGTALLEFVPALKLSDSPWSNLGFPLTLVYEDATYSRTTPYYAADKALTAKLGLLWQATYPGAAGDSFAFTIQAQGGVYSSPAFSDAAGTYPCLSTLGRADWIRSSATYSVSLEASAVDPFASSPQYWSLSLVGGIRAKDAALIAP
jgi:tetratricopeptide (TPR) repeat protein